jgi:hypothetical protein
MSPAKKTKRAMSDDHKAALAEGRSQGRAVRRYLEALDAHKPKRGRKRTPDSIKKRLDRIETDLATADPLKRWRPSSWRPPRAIRPARASPAPRGARWVFRHRS